MLYILLQCFFKLQCILICILGLNTSSMMESVKPSVKATSIEMSKWFLFMQVADADLKPKSLAKFSLLFFRTSKVANGCELVGGYSFLLCDFAVSN